jgi:hypothetical protein
MRVAFPEIRQNNWLCGGSPSNRQGRRVIVAGFFSPKELAEFGQALLRISKRVLQK